MLRGACGVLFIYLPFNGFGFCAQSPDEQDIYNKSDYYYKERQNRPQQRGEQNGKHPACNYPHGNKYQIYLALEFIKVSIKSKQFKIFCVCGVVFKLNFLPAFHIFEPARKQ